VQNDGLYTINNISGSLKPSVLPQTYWIGSIHTCQWSARWRNVVFLLRFKL